jgi:serine/threonine protein kinase
MAMSEMEGQIIAGRFRVERLLGEGGMGSVYEATHETLPRKFAIKILRPELAHDKNFIERFRREAIAAARVEHPNVIYITDFGYTEDGSVYLVMEYLEGKGLDELICHQTRLPVNRALPILIQTADALHHAHQQKVVHRDLKPENILLTNVRGQKDFVKILDFGIAKLREPEFDNVALTMKGQVFGTAEYMSPEQATGEPLDGRSDLYAVGVLAYEMLTGDPPFLGAPMEVLRAHVKTPPLAPSTKLRDHHIPLALDALVLRCLAKDPAQRYQNGAELRRDLMKVRALLFSMSDEIVDRRRKPSGYTKLDAHKLAEGWSGLGGKVPDILTALSSESGFLDAEPLPTSTSMHPEVRTDPEKLREDYREVLRELSMALVQAVLAPTETTEILERLLVTEEEIASLTGTIALSEQNFDRIRFEYSQREKRLRYAVLDLSMEQAKLKGLSAVDPGASEQFQQQIDDLTYQIRALEGSCKEVDQERTEQIQELDVEVKRYRQTRTELEEEAIVMFQNLHSQVEALRPTATSEALQELYAKLDGLRTSLDEAMAGPR